MKKRFLIPVLTMLFVLNVASMCSIDDDDSHRSRKGSEDKNTVDDSDKK